MMTTTARDEFCAFMATTYWGNKGSFPVLQENLHKLVPVEGEVKDADKNPALEKFRKAVNCYYDLYNNGLCNRKSEFRAVFGIVSSKYKIESVGSVGAGTYLTELYQLVETEMDKIILAAGREQGLI